MAFILGGCESHIEERPEAFHTGAFLNWRNHGSVACQLLRMKTSATYSRPPDKSPPNTWMVCEQGALVPCPLPCSCGMVSSHVE